MKGGQRRAHSRITDSKSASGPRQASQVAKTEVSRDAAAWTPKLLSPNFPSGLVVDGRDLGDEGGDEEDEVVHGLILVLPRHFSTTLGKKIV